MVAHSAVEEDISGTSADRSRPSGKPTPSRETRTHFPSFRSEDDFRTIERTSLMLEESGFYWGPMTVDEAHSKLADQPTGTFLIRDSRQKDVFFTLSYRASTGPASVRIKFQNSRFTLTGSKESFESLLKLLEYYAKKNSLTQPYRKIRVQSLQELCRRQIVKTCDGRVALDEVPVNQVLKDFLLAFPHWL